jgi:hypothetical protein
MNYNYTVKLDNRRVTYVADYQCEYCGWVDNDRSFFYETDGKLYCSLHKKGVSNENSFNNG